jgi:hypothetical protein
MKESDVVVHCNVSFVEHSVLKQISHGIHDGCNSRRLLGMTRDIMYETVGMRNDRKPFWELLVTLVRSSLIRRRRLTQRCHFRGTKKQTTKNDGY